MGEAKESEVAKAIHHVCSSHMMKIIKSHAKELCEKDLPADSQRHIAMRFFGRLILSSTLKEMNYIVRLGHFIFKSKFVNDVLIKKLDEFCITIVFRTKM